MTIKTTLKATALLGLLAWALPARAGKYDNLEVYGSSASRHVGFQDDSGTLRPGLNKDRVFTSSGAAVVQSTSTVSAHKVFRVLKADATEALSVTQGGTLTAPVLTQTTNPTNCSSGNYPLGVDGSGNAENCTPAGAGDAVLNSTQTWSGGNKLYGSTTFYGEAYFALGFASTTVRARQTTTSTAWVFQTGSSTTITTKANSRVLLTVNISLTNNTAGDTAQAVPVLEGLYILPHYDATTGCITHRQADAASIHNDTQSCTLLTPVLSAGPHIFSVWFRSPAGTTVATECDSATAGTKGAPCVITAVEFPTGGL